MRIGLNTSPICKTLGLREVDRAFKFASDAGYECIEISGKYHYDSPKRFKEKTGDIRSALKKYNLEATAISYHVNPLHSDLEERRKLNNNIRHLIEAASSLNIPYLITMAGLPDINFGDLLLERFYSAHPPPDKKKAYEERNESAWTDFRDVMGKLVDFAGEHDIKICIEPHLPTMVYDVSTAERMFKVISSRNLGLNYDPSNLIPLFIDPTTIITRMGDRIYHTHVKDVEVAWDKLKWMGVLNLGKENFWRLRVPGYGDINWGKFIDALKSVGYDNVLSYENYDETMSFKEGAEKALKFLKAFV